MHKVLIPTKLDKFASDMLTEHGYTVVQDTASPLSDLCKANADAEAVIVRSEAITPEIINLLPKLALVVRAGAGFNTIDIKYARKRNVDVMNTPGANSNAVAEEVVALILAASRKVVPADISTRAGNWEKSKFMGHEITGKTIGILGLGHIGQLLVKRLSGFEMKVLAFDPMLSPALATKLGVEIATVEKIFAESDFVSLHIPENNETRGMVNAALLNTMKEGAMLINCARSGIINEADLRTAKAAKKLLFVNDVYAKDIAGEKSVADIADVMLPHLGANTFEANFCAAKKAAEQTIAYFEQGVTSCVVNKALPDGLDGRFQKLAYALTRLSKNYLGAMNPTRIETSFYGDLAKFAKWMTAPIAAGIAEEFAGDSAASDAQAFLATRGVELVNREVDNAKKYGDSMTIDLFATEGGKTIFKASVRGTLAENRLMVSRFNEYENLYLEPNGNHLVVEYADQVGVLGKIAGMLGEAGINITDVRAPQSADSKNALAVLTTDKLPDTALVDKIAKSVNAKSAFTFTFQN